MDSDTSTPNRRITFWLFLGITLLIGMDVATDLIAGSGLAHVAIEGSILLLAAGGLLQVWIENRHLRRQADDLGADLATSRAEALAWRNEAASALAGLAEAVDHQFARWELTEAESDVARYLLKGLSLKEIAALRAVSERTVRDQARAVYRKGQLQGRADLAAFFLEDLLAPAGTRPSLRSLPDVSSHRG